MPVCAVSFLGIVSASSGSTIATSGVMLKSASGYLTPFASSVMTENAVTSVAVPEVEGIAQKRAFVRSVGKWNGTQSSSKLVSGYS